MSVPIPLGSVVTEDVKAVKLTNYLAEFRVFIKM